MAEVPEIATNLADISTYDCELPDVDTDELLSLREHGDDVELGEFKLCGQSCIRPVDRQSGQVVHERG